MATSASTSYILELLLLVCALTTHTHAQSSITNPQIQQGGENDVDSVGGASGDDSSAFQLSTGGIVAIAVVCALVALIGIASAVLFVVAKRRGWEVRKSIARMSRRMVGRASTAKTERQERADRRRGTVRLDSPNKTSNRMVDLEKGKAGKTVRTAEVAEKDTQGDRRTAKFDKVIPQGQGWSVGGSRR